MLERLVAKRCRQGLGGQRRWGAQFETAQGTRPGVCGCPYGVEEVGFDVGYIGRDVDWLRLPARCRALVSICSTKYLLHQAVRAPPKVPSTLHGACMEDGSSRTQFRHKVNGSTLQGEIVGRSRLIPQSWWIA